MCAPVHICECVMCSCAGIWGICMYIRRVCVRDYVRIKVWESMFDTEQEKWAKEAGGSEGTEGEERNLWMRADRYSHRLLYNKASSLNLWAWPDKYSWSSTLVRLSVVPEPWSYFTSQEYNNISYKHEFVLPDVFIKLFIENSDSLPVIFAVNSGHVQYVLSGKSIVTIHVVEIITIKVQISAF